MRKGPAVCLHTASAAAVADLLAATRGSLGVPCGKEEPRHTKSLF